MLNKKRGGVGYDKPKKREKGARQGCVVSRRAHERGGEWIGRGGGAEGTREVGGGGSSVLGGGECKFCKYER